MREQWKFTHGTEHLVKACEEKRAHHEARLTHYEAEHTNVMAEIKERGLNFEEVQYTGGSNLVAKADPVLAERLKVARRRRDFHRERAAEFARWKRAFELSSEAQYQLDIEDVEFFGL